MESEELKELKDEFAKCIDVPGIVNLRKWFNKYPELSIIEMIEISGKSKTTIRTWRRRAGMLPRLYTESNGRILTHKPKPTVQCKPLPKLNVPDDWENNPDWMREQVKNGISKYALARILHCSEPKINRILNTYYEPTPPEVIQMINEL